MVNATRWFKYFLGGLFFVGGVLVLRQVQAERSQQVRAAETASQPAASRPALPPLPPLHAVAMQLYQFGQARQSFYKQVDEIAGLGADAILLAAHGYQEHAGSNHISLEISAMPDEEQWRDIIGYCRKKGLRVIVMPTVQLTNPRGSEWRGRIQPQDWNEWWADYYAMILRLAKICEFNQVDVFLVGSELISTEKDADRWKKLIGLVRKEYGGRIGYSANWDHYENLSFLNELDVLGMTSYHSLIKPPIQGRAPTVEELVQPWQPIRAKILEFAKKKNMPILFTEVGYASQEGITSDPWNYYLNMKATPEGMKEQANAYQAFVEVFEGQPGVAGVVFWEWLAPGGTNDFGYTPRGKPAEAIMRSYFSKSRTRSQPTETSKSQNAETPKSRPGK